MSVKFHPDEKRRSGGGKAASKSSKFADSPETGMSGEGQHFEFYFFSRFVTFMVACSNFEISA